MTRTHVLTGAGSGIGREVARRLTDRGDRVILLARTEERVDDLVREFPSYYSAHPVDLADLDTVDAFARELGRGRPAIDRIDSLVHVAGVVDLGPVADLDAANWQHHLDVNLTAPALLTAGLLPLLRPGHGTVVFVNSTAGLAASAGWSAYAASKFGLRALADSLRAEEAAYGVRVTTVFPSRTATPMQEQVHEQEGLLYDPSRWIRPETVADEIVRILDLPSDATITDVTVRSATVGGPRDPRQG